VTVRIAGIGYQPLGKSAIDPQGLFLLGFKDLVLRARSECDGYAVVDRTCIVI
jgi:hypothetical protein